MKLRYLGTIATAVMLVAVACGGPAATVKPPTAAPATATPAPATPAPATPTAPAEDPLGTRTIPAGEPIHLVFWGVLTGADSSLGIDSQRGVELAIEARGSEMFGREISLTTEDGGCSPEGGNTAATRMAADPTIVGLIGSSCSDETVGGIELITNAGLTTISSSNTRPALTAADRDETYAGYLRTAHNDEFQGAKAAEFVYDVLGLRKAATIHDGSSYAQALQGVFADEFVALGGEITLQTAVGAADEDMTTVLEDVAASAPDFIYYPVFTGPFGFITDQVRGIPGLETVALMGADAAFSSAAIEAGGANALGMYLSSPDTRQFVGDYDAFLAAHTAKYGENPLSIFHAHAYDAANMMMDAIEDVAVENADGSLSIGLGALRDRIYATENFPGITGVLTCGEFGDCGAPAIGVYQITQAVVDDPTGPAFPPAPIWPEL